MRLLLLLSVEERYPPLEFDQELPCASAEPADLARISLAYGLRRSPQSSVGEKRHGVLGPENVSGTTWV